MASTELRAAAQQALEALEAGLDVDPIVAGETADALRAALAEPQEPVAWTPVTEAMPKSGVKVLACYRNRLGNLRRIRAMWTAAKTEEASSEDAEACSEYDEATDTYYVTEGWYECIDNWGDYSSVAVTEGEVTHWMPLPPDPDSAPPQRPAEPVQELGPWTLEQCDRVIRTLRYIEGIAARGEGRPMREDETLEQFILGYVQKLEAGQPAALAEPVQEFASIPGTNVRVRLPVQEPAQKTEMRRCPRCWEPMFPPQPTPLTVERLRDALVAARIVPPAAVEDPDGYDDGVTLHRIEALHRRLA